MRAKASPFEIFPTRRSAFRSQARNPANCWLADGSGRFQCRLAVHGRTTLDVGLIRAKVGRLSVTGELGYEINCDALEHTVLRRLLFEAGQDLGVGSMAMSRFALRLEKSFGIWSAEFTQILRLV